METRVDRILRWAKNNPVISVFIVIGIFIIILGTLTDAMKKISDFADRYSGRNRSTATLTGSKLEYSQEKIPITTTEEIKPEYNKEKYDRQNTDECVRALIASLKNLTDDYYATTNLINGVRRIKGGITGSQFADIISSAQIDNDYYCSLAITSCSKCLIQPVTDKDIESILSSIKNNYYRKNAAEALFGAISR